MDADYNFLFADVRCQGKISDGSVFYEKLEKCDLYIPNRPNLQPLTGSNRPVPYVFVADAAFE